MIPSEQPIRRAIAELSIDAQRLEAALLAVPIGELITYERLSDMIGRNVQHEARGVLASVRRRILARYSMYFDPVRNVGLKNSDDVGKVAAGSRGPQQVRRLAKRRMRELASVTDFNALPNDQKLQHNTNMGILGMLHYATKPTNVKKIASATQKADAALAAAKALEALKGKV